MSSSSSHRRVMPTKNTIDLLALIQLLWNNAFAIILAAVVFGAAAFGYTALMVAPTYTASTSLYVNNSKQIFGASNSSISTNELTASSSLVDTYIWVLNSRETLQMVITDTGLDYTTTELSKMISTNSVENTSGFTVYVTSHDPAEAEVIANSIAEILPDRITEVVDGSSVRVVDHAIIPSQRSGPSYSRNTIIGVLFGAMFACVFIALRGIISETSNQIIRGTEELRDCYDLPILAAVPDMRHTGLRKYGYNYGYGKDKKKSPSSDEKKGA